MSGLSGLAGRHTTLSARDVEHLHRLLAEWQLLADLAFSDCLLMAPTVGAERFLILAQVRPYPAQTLYQEDMVGRFVDVLNRPKVALAFREGRIVREGDPEWHGGVPVREEAVPVLLEGRVLAVISAEQNLAAARTPSHLELSYLRAAGDLERMIAEGTFPYIVEEEFERELLPRVGDGFLQLDAEGRVTYASPNAVSAYRRLGLTANIAGERLVDLDPAAPSVARMLATCRPVEDEVEANGTWVLRRFLPVVHAGDLVGAVGLVRDITELRRRDRMLSIKDATIREIHHRVKNNLQTVASLLRLQARRLGTSEARAELEESVRRISSIALVHETLSQNEVPERVDFDRVAHGVLDMAAHSLVGPDRPIEFAVVGSSGDLSSDVATPLSLILAELIQNAVEHAFKNSGGSVTVEMHRASKELRLVVIDDGAGLPSDFALESSANLGLQIVGTLVRELRGDIDLQSSGGTRVELVIPIGRE
ncbi:MAG: histidine kinase N-terminal domain-containing protein [Actinomycetota bacterium]